ncbi:MAG: nucleotide sugar dehydrogenase [Planctomycetota bacterium]|nr:MAG: nucleotide sugar dehydrogenase [Planctomycetota bacterium]RLS94846.1 MAG: nucleotide sugar dehydrogenase [Planctomycetota bacterium]
MTTPASILLSRIERCEARIGVIGLGYVGLPLAHALHQGGLPVLGFDIDQSKIDAIAAGRNYLQHLGNDLVTTLRDSARFEATTDFARLGEADVIIICVPTPLGRHSEPDISYIIDTAKAIGRTLRAGQLVILESTTYPRTTRDDMMPAIMAAAGDRAQSLKVGRDVFGAFSPEREDPGRKSHSTSSIPKLVGGLDAMSTELASAVYRKGVTTVVSVSSAEVAESAKLLENIFRAVNIALVNELKIVLDAMDIDVWEVVRAASTKPFGFMPFYPGPGLGGHCIPIDPFYLTWKAKEYGLSTRFIELAGEVNTSMPHYVIDRLAAALNDHSKSVKGSRILVIGLAYKAEIDDVRESPSFELIELCQNRGAHVDYHDPLVPTTRAGRKHDLQMSSVAVDAASIASYDCVLISTAHSSIDYAAIAQHAKLVVDTRDAMRAFESSMGTRLVRA